MIQVISGILTPTEAKDLQDMGKSGAMYSDFSHEIIQKVAKVYQSELDDQELVLTSPSYWRIETRPKGHEWHYDGCKEEDGKLVDNHMAWCNYGSTLLLSPNNLFEGGNLFFEQEGKEFEIKDHYLNGVLYSAGKFNNPMKHKVTQHAGKRCVLLMFFSTKPVSKDQLKG